MTQTVLSDLALPGALDQADEVHVGTSGVFLVSRQTRSLDEIVEQIDALQSKSDALASKIDCKVTPIYVVQNALPSGPVVIIDRTIVCIAQAVAHVVEQRTEPIKPDDVPLVVSRVVCAAEAPRLASPKAGKARLIEQQQTQMRRYSRQKMVHRGFLAVMVPILAITAKVIWSAPPPRASLVPKSTTTAQALVTAAPLVDSPKISFAPECPVLGQGWTMAAQWPGRLANLKSYDYLVQSIFTGEWASVGQFTDATTQGVALQHLTSGSAIAVQVIPVFIDGTKGDPIVSNVVVPSDAC